MISEARSPAPEDRPAPAPRVPALDAAKGIAIVLVVVCHVWGSLVASGRIERAPLAAALVAYVYTFHVPLFFFVAGMVMSDPRREGFYARVGGTLVYPYVLWSLLQGCAVAAAGSAANFPMTFGDVIPSVLINPSHQMWFMHTLIVGTFLIGVAVRAGYSRRDVLVGSVLLSLVPLIVDLPHVVFTLAHFAIYLATGWWIGLPSHFPPARTAAPAFGLLALAVALGWHEVDVLRPALAALGILGTIAVAAARPIAPLCALGRASLALYVAHVLATAPSRWLPMPMLMGSILGLGIPYVLWRVAEARSLPLFRWPARSPRGSDGEQPRRMLA